MSRKYDTSAVRFGMNLMKKPPKLKEMKKEKIICESCGRYAEKYAEAKTYKYFFCEKEKKVISIKKMNVIDKEIKKEVSESKVL